MSEKLLKKYIKTILKEESMTNQSVVSEPFLPSVKSWRKKAEMFFNELKKTQMGNDVISITFGKTGPSRRRIRFGSKVPANPAYSVIDILNSIQSKLLSVSAVNIDSLSDQVMMIPPAGSVGDRPSQRNYSAKSPAYYIPGLDINVTFGGQGATSGQRGGGYAYENEILAKVKASTRLPVVEGEDNHKTDVFIDVPSGRIGIEVKLQNAQAGEPTMYYNFVNQQFVYKGSNEEAVAMAGAINDSLDNRTRSLMMKIKDTIGLNSNELTGVTTDQYFNVLRAPGGVLSTSAELASFNISADIIRNYYKKKGAQFVQVKGKGLFHIESPAILRTSAGEVTTSLFNFDSVMGLIQFRKTSDTRYAMRTQFKGNPLRSLPASSADLDNPEQLQAFIEYIAPGSSITPGDPESDLAVIREFIMQSLAEII